MKRAETIALEFIKKRARKVTCNDCIITLDGIGNNRRAFQKTFARENLPCPRIITCECQPVVALCQRILYGNDVLLTCGDPTIRSKRRLHGGVAPPLIEDLILQIAFP
jgi:ribosomal protein L34E